MFTYHIVSSIPASDIVNALAHGLDSLPPGYYLFLKGVCGVMGTSQLAVRLPSLLAFYGFLISILLLLWKRVDPALAVLATMMPLYTGAADCALSARPYALVSCAFGFTVVVWSKMDERIRLWQSISMAFLLALAIAFHFYSVLLVVTVAIMEILCFLRVRKIRWSVWIALVAGGGSVFLWWPVIAPIYRWTHANSAAAHYYAKPTIMALLGNTTEMVATFWLSTGLLALVCGAALLEVLLPQRAILPGQNYNAQNDKGQYNDDYWKLIIIGVAATALPLLTFIFAREVTGVFNTRYFYAAVLGFAVLGAHYLRRLPNVGTISFILIGVMSGVLSRQAYVGTRVGNLPNSGANNSKVSLAIHAPGDLPIVVPDGSDFFELMEYAPATLRQRLVYVDLPVGLTQPDPEPQVMVHAWKPYRSDMNVLSAEEFFGSNRRFYVLFTGYAREGLSAWLFQHYVFRVVDRTSKFWLFEVEEKRPPDSPTQ
jgi:hypothetical protein